MKKTIFSIITLTLVTALTLSCNQSPNKNCNNQANDTMVAAENKSLATPIANDTLAKQNEQAKVDGQAKNFSIEPIIRDYLVLKNALAADNDKLAAKAGKQLLATLKTVDMKTVPANKHSDYMEITDNAKENAEHIGDNTGKIDHQREHLASLSKDISDLITMLGTTQQLYQDFCPMYNKGKGAVWISEIKEIKNPYYGNKMLTCGSVKMEF